MTNRFSFIIFIALFISEQLYSQPLTQTIRGTVIDNASNSPVLFASVVILNTNPLLGTTTDTAGNFSITKVPVGRYDVQVSCVGYEPSISREVIVSSARETFLTISLKQSGLSLGEVIIKPNVNKEQPINSMATVSARMLSVEEAKRYAGGFDDPARLASSFAGVASNTRDNGLVVRGNAPKFFQWKMEGIEIPNPNHFADLDVFGGGGLTALSSQMLANSDFFTGAFPAEYNNALSGVFDIAMRTGNNQQNENTVQVGTIGIDVSSEGPVKKNNRSSYLFNYRYSTLALVEPLLPENAQGVRYQDLSFKLNFPTKKSGIFSVWGIGLADRSGQNAKTDSTLWVYDTDKEEQDIKQYMGAAGVSQKFFFNNDAYLKTTLAATASSIDLATDRLNSQLTLAPQRKIANTSWSFNLSSFVNKKYSAKHTNRTGILVTGLMYDLLLKDAVVNDIPPITIVQATGFSTLVSAYTNSSVSLTENLLMNIGLNTQFFTLNSHYTIEPRAGFRYQVLENQSIGLAYGFHSRLERLNYYFNNSITTGEKEVNKNLDFTKAHHFILSHDLNITDLIHLRIEPYFQQLLNVPVIADSSFSFINLKNDWFFAEKLQNTGEGRNYGLDLTFEKYISKGYYYLLSASVFNSEYKGGDRIWRNTRFNRNYLFNFLIGKEWQLGKNRQKVFSLNVRFSHQGGDHYSPVNETESDLAKDVIYDENNAFQMQVHPSFTAHFTAAYKINLKRSSIEIEFKVLNATGEEDFLGHRYNLMANAVDPNAEELSIPNLSLRVEF